MRQSEDQRQAEEEEERERERRGAERAADQHVLLLFVRFQRLSRHLIAPVH